MSDKVSPSFQPGDQVIWWKQAPGSGYVYPVPARVLKVTAQRVQIEGDDDGRIVKRYVAPANLQNQGASQPARQPTEKQGQYLAFIYSYTNIHRRPPSEADMQDYFRATPPTVHDMILRLERHGWIERTPGQARSIRVLVPPEELPPLA